MHVHLKVHAGIIRIWNQPPADRPEPDRDLRYYRHPDIEPAAVLARLREMYPAQEIRAALISALEKSLEILVAGRKLSERQRFLAACCMELLDRGSGVAADAMLVKRLVREFDPLYWHRALRRLVNRHLTAMELLDTLHDGMTSARFTSSRIPPLEGVRMYRGFVKPGTTSRRSRAWFDAVRVTIAKLEQHPSGETRREAAFASRWLTELATGP